MTRLTEKGVRVVLAIVAVLLYGLLLWDVLLILVGVAGLGFTLYLYIEARRKSHQLELVSVAPTALSIMAIAGKTVSETIEVSSPTDYTLTADLPYLKVNPERLTGGESVVELIYSPVLGGVKKLNMLSLKSMDRYGLFTGERDLDVDYIFTAYPRVFPVVAQAISMLAGMGLTGEGRAPKLIGSGTEYADTRLYVPGDSLKHFDWKAYAKTTKPMVKEYYDDSEGGTGIVYDRVADNPVSLDELNHAFLSLVLSLTQREEKTRITLVNNDKPQVYELNRFNTLLLSIQIALKGQSREFKEYYALLDPLTSRRSLVEKILEQDIQPTSSGHEYSQSIIISSLTGNPTTLLRTIERNGAMDKSILVPTRPWIWQTSLRESHRTYRAHMRLIGQFKRQGVKILSSTNSHISQ